MKNRKESSQSSIHTAETLLSNAYELLELNQQSTRRAAILEAATALEAYVQQTIFPYLRRKLGDDLTDLLEKKTRMDFDSRLSVLTPFAMGIPVETQSRLWNEYKKLRKLRNQVVHLGKAVSRNEAALAVSVAAEFMNYIGFTVELELRLLEFKDSMETGNYTGETKKDIEEYFMEYFKPAKFTTYVVKDEFGGEFKYTKIDFSHHSLLLRIKDARRGSTHLLESIPVGIMAEALSDAKAIRGIWLRIVERSDPIRLQMLKSQYEELILFCEIIQPK